jgi:hypothetical protein
VYDNWSGNLNSLSSMSPFSGTYENNANCEWILAPQNARQVFIIFKVPFDTVDQSDVVRVLECTSVECSETREIAKLYGSYSSQQAMVSSTGFMKVVFTSDRSITAMGFQASWNSVQPPTLHMRMPMSCCHFDLTCYNLKLKSTSLEVCQT